MSIEIRLLKESEIDSVIDFYNKTKNIDHKGQKTLRDRITFEWEFIKGPYGKAIYIIAVDNTNPETPKIVGTQCAIPIKMVSSTGEMILSAKSEDLYLDINAMRKFKKVDILKEIHQLLISECIKAGIQFIWGITNVTATHHRLNFEMIAKSQQGIKVINIKNSFDYLSVLNPKNTFFDRFKILLLTTYSGVINLKNLFISSTTKNIKISNREKNNYELIRNISPDGSNFLNIFQDDNYLKWRLFENTSDNKYFIRQFHALDDKLCGEIIYSIKDKVAYFEQILFHAELNQKTKEKLILQVIREITQKGISLIRVNGYNHNIINKNEFDLLQKLGFIFINRGIWFAAKPLNKHNFKLENIYINRLYTQGI